MLYARRIIRFGTQGKGALYRRKERVENMAYTKFTRRTPRNHHITPVLKSLHYLKISERIQFKVLSLTYDSLQYSQPTYLHQLFTINPLYTQSSLSLPRTILWTTPLI